MSRPERRHEQRANPTIRFTPVNCSLVCEGVKSPLEIVNYHYRGACLKVQIGDYRPLEKSTYLQFRIGMKEISERILFKVVWETISENGIFGIEFTTESSFVLSRAERFLVNSINTPVISGQDPLDPNRIIYFKVTNVSSTGMLLSTSLSNKHLFPGMELRGSLLTIPGIGKTEVDLFIENCRSSEDDIAFFGVSIKGTSNNYQTLMSKYLSNLGKTENVDERIEKLAEANFSHKELRKHLTIKEVSTEAEYEKVLKLRFVGYKLAGKIDPTKTWKDMGNGIENEGIILAAFLGGQLVATCEFRLSDIHGMRLSKTIDVKQIPELRDNKMAEINKLVVHPKAQSSDVVLGIFQKIHALAMLNGRPDGLIAAEEKLISLYERLGFRKTKFSYPHPVKENTSLTLMVIYHEAYASSEGMNPSAWAVAFEETQKFFDSIGINKTHTLNVTQKTSKILSSILFRLRKKKKKNASSANEVYKSTMNVKSVIDPKWTKPHLNATIMYPYLHEANLLIGEEKVRKILGEMNFEFSHFENIGNWISIDFFDEFIEKFSEHGDPYLLNRNAGYKSFSKEVLKSNYFIVKHFFSPRIAFKKFEIYLPKFNKTRIYQIVDSGSNFTRIKISNPDRSLLPKHPSAKENWFALADGYVKALTGRPAEITSIKSAFDGDEYCEFIVKWQNPMFKPSYLLAAGLALSSIYGFYDLFLSDLNPENLAVYGSVGIAISLVGFFSLKAKNYKKKYEDMVESLSDYERTADEKYKELQSSKMVLEKSYQEGKVLETLNKEIQNSDQLSSILQTGLDYLCTKFDFKRSFIMIKDENSKYLRTTSVFGAEGPFKELWDFKVDISVKRENSLVISSAFHSGQSILINNIDEHKFHLNQASRMLVEKLATQGFAIVPIPSADPQNWGVLVADKGTSSDIISRRDLVALQRIAQSLGIALDKKSKLESEIRTRKIFQKYVPSVVIEKVLGERDAKLGGQSREAICLFFDIRNFTALSTQIPPEILCELLNNIYDLLHKSVSKTNGVIDKFLGDGALVTWGAIPGSEINPEQAIIAAKEFFNELDKLNSTITAKGLKPIEIGMGIHRGQVVAGNIGTQERMEFTVIGNTVNIASRLEQLSKIFKCHLVISQELMPFELLDNSWSIKPGVQVRGLDKTIEVAVYTHIPPTELKKAETA